MSLNALTVFAAVCGLCALLALVICQWRAPRTSFVLWCAALVFVPVWVGVNAGVFWSVATVLTALAVATNLPWMRWHPIDACLLGFVVLVVAMNLIGEVRLAPLVTALLEWVLPYLWGRMVLSRLSGGFVLRVIATAATVVAVLAVLEFLTGTNLFVAIPGSGVAHATWSPLQDRAGFIRAEGAMGHSIALGSVLAMAAAFVIAAPWPFVVRVLALAFLGAAVVLSFSRIALVGFAVTVALAALLMKDVSRRARAGLLTILAVAVLAVLPFLSSVLESAGDEADGSAGYRTDLVILLSQVRPIGGAGAWESLIVDGQYLGYFARSVDNAIVSILLRFGWLPTALLFMVVVGAILMSIRRSRSAAAVALVGQVPSLFVVALITQYGMFYWFTVGLAVAWAALPAAEPTGSEQADLRARSTIERGRMGIRRRGVSHLDQAR